MKTNAPRSITEPRITMPEGPEIICTVDGICYSEDGIRRLRAENVKLRTVLERIAPNRYTFNSAIGASGIRDVLEGKS